MSSETYYSILNCEQTASFEEIKRNYQELIKCNHPDKGRQASSDKFIKLNEAWHTLKDDKLRKQYDASLLQTTMDDRPLIYAELNKSDLNFTDSSVAHFICRCGQDIEIDKTELVDEETLFECTECSNYIIVFNK